MEKIKRQLTSEVIRLLNFYPIVSLTGPRQSGKTTLSRMTFPDWPYYSLEEPNTRQLIANDPRTFLYKGPKRMILDEVQRYPDLLSYLQTIVDLEPDRKYIITGSQNLLMSEKISQSLAGRVAVLHLLPLSNQELFEAGYTFDNYEELLFRGHYPRLYSLNISPDSFYPFYTETYVERDVRQLQNIGDTLLFTRFLSLCAGRIGQLVNFSALANETGVDTRTVQRWLGILQASFIIHLLPPYFKNFNKRITKTAKLYFHDTGLACYLLNLKSTEALRQFYNLGGLFENFVINEMIKYRYNQAKRPAFYFWRDSNGREIDLLIDRGNDLLPIEIKSSRTFGVHFLENINYFHTIATQAVAPGYVVYGGEEAFPFARGRAVSWRATASIDSSD